MKKKKILLIVSLMLALLLMLFINSANSKSGKSNLNYSSSALNIYKPSYWKWIDDVNAKFSEANPGIEINTIEFNDYLAYQEKLISELYAGKGPDVILTRSGQVQELLRNEVLSDLTNVVPSGFNMKEYGGNIQEAGVVGGKRYYFVVDYYLPFFYTAKSLLDKAKIPDSSFQSWENFAKLAKSYKDQGKYLIGGLPQSQDKFFLYMLDWSGTEYMDYANNTSKFKTNQAKIIKMMELYKNDILPAICPQEELAKFKSVNEAMKAGLFVLNFSDEEGYKRLWMVNSLFNSYLNSELLVIPLPSDSTPGKKYINTIAAVNANSKHKKEAFEYIKALMSGDTECQYTVLPASKRLADAQLADCRADEKGVKRMIGTESGVVKPVFLPLNLTSKLDSISATAIFVVHDFRVQSVITVKINEYIKKKKSAQDTIKIIDSTINRLLQE